MKTFIVTSSFLFLLLYYPRVNVSSSSFPSQNEPNPTPSKDSSENIGEIEETFKEIKKGFGDIVEPDDDDLEESIEDEEPEYDYDVEEDLVRTDLKPITPVEVETTSRREGCKCSNGSIVVVCECFGDSVKSVPKNLTGVSRLTLTGTGIETFPSNCFKQYSNTLEELDSLKNLRKLRSLYITKAPRLTRIPWRSLKMLKFLRIKETAIESVHLVFPSESDLQFDIIDIENNRIRNLSRNSIHVKASGVNFDFNSIQRIEDFTFNGSHIYKLSLKGNKGLSQIGTFAFDGLRYLKVLDLSETSIVRLPTIGLHDLEILKVMNTRSLKVIPSVYNFKRIKEAHLTYSYHCCAFKFPASHDQAQAFRKSILRMKRRYCPEGSGDKKNHMIVKSGSPKSLSNDLNIIPNPPQERKLLSFQFNDPHLETSENDGKFIEGRILNETGDRKIPESAFDTFRKEAFGTIAPSSSSPERDGKEGNTGIAEEEVKNIEWEESDSEQYSDGHKPLLEAYCGDFVEISLDVKCFPEPDALNPCEDVMGNVVLRVSVWIVVVMAVLGNLAVLVVLMSSRFTMTVSKFLMCNLAFADLMMGIYLLLIAIIDMHTIGVYFNHALDWQEGFGCQAAGFITVFASELSIYSLTVITLERWYAITYAIHLNRRLKLGVAVKIMIGGWIYSVFMALLPVLGVSGYSRTSICLPMEHATVLDVTYLTVLLTVNAIAFTIICLCYGKMYLSIAGQQTRATLSDLTVAKRMALLVFTDFACWAPIAFFGLTAVAGHPLISVTNSKFLLVFFYPLNSCANPYLYAILTKQYRRDFFILTSRYGFCSERAAKYKGTSSGQAPKPASRHESPVRPVSRSTLSHDSQEVARKIECRNLKVMCQKCKEDSTKTTGDESGGSRPVLGKRKCRCLLYSAMDPIQIENSLSSDSTHEIIKIECINGETGDRTPARKVISALKRPFASNDTSISSSHAKNAAKMGNGEKRNHGKQPEGDSSDIIRRVMDLTSGPRTSNKMKSASSCNNIHKSHKNCTSFVQRDSSSSGDKSTHSQPTSEGEVTLWVRREKSHFNPNRSKLPIENPAFSFSSHSNTHSNASPAESQF